MKAATKPLPGSAIIISAWFNAGQPAAATPSGAVGLEVNQVQVSEGKVINPMMALS